MKFTMGNETKFSMAMHRSMYERGEISLQEFHHMNSLLYFTYMSSPFGA